MRILFMPHSYFPNVGGVEISTSNLAREFQNRGHQVIVVTSRGHYFKRSNEFPLHQIVDGIKVFRCDFVYPYLFSGLKAILHFLLCFPITLLRLMFIMIWFNPDIVSIQFPWTQSFYFLLVKVFFRSRLVVSARGVRDVNDLPGNPKPKLWQFMRRCVLKQADIFTANSQYLLNKALNIYSKESESYCVIPNGVSLNDFSEVDCQKETRPYIFAIGRLHHDKGFDVLIHAFSKLVSYWPDLNLIIAGEGQEKSNLEVLVDNLKLTERVKFVGTVLGKKKQCLFSNCKIFVLPSRREPFGITILEAMACSKPVIASNVGGVPEFVRNRENGILIAPENPEILAEAIDRLIRDSNKCKQMGKANRHLVGLTYNWEKIADQYDAIFRRIINA